MSARLAAVCLVRVPHSSGGAALARRALLARSLQPKSSVYRSTRKLWDQLRASRAGKRFQHFHDAQGARRLGWARALTLLAVVLCLAIGVVLAFIPGPAILFFALAAALTATQSRWLACKLDRAEIYVHALWRKHKRRRRQRQDPVPKAAPKRRPSARRRPIPAPGSH
jgi:hypothetical protein